MRKSDRVWRCPLADRPCLFDFLQPYLFTSHFESWSGLLRSPIAWRPVIDGLITFAGWILVTTGLAYLHFRRKDILS